MIWNLALCCGVALALLFHYFYVARGRLIFGPETLFLLLATGTFVVTLRAAADAGQSTSPYVLFIAAGIVCFILGTALCNLLVRFHHPRELRRFAQAPWDDDLTGAQLGVILVTASVASVVALVHFYSVGFLVPIWALLELFRSGKEGMSLVYNELRVSTDGASLFGPGYVSQFTNTLLPLTTVLLYYRMRIRPSIGSRGLFAILLAITVGAAMGTGTRFHVAAFFALFCFIGFARFMEPFRFGVAEVAAVAAVALLLLSSLTLLMGPRGQETLTEGEFLWAPLQVLDRIVGSPARERYRVYDEFLQGLEPRWGGGALEELRQILPGPSSYTLSNRLHELLYGNPAGNVGLDVWGASWYDFRWFSGIFLLLLGFAYHAFYIVLIRGPKRFIRVVTLAYAGFVLGLASDLQVLLLRGFATLLLFLGGIWLLRSIGPPRTGERE